MNKRQLVARVADRLGTSHSGAQVWVDAVLDAVSEALRTEGTVTLSGFGTFEVKPRKARVGRNPHTGQPIRIEAGRRVGFRVGKTLKDSL